MGQPLSPTPRFALNRQWSWKMPNGVGGQGSPPCSEAAPLPILTFSLGDVNPFPIGVNLRLWTILFSVFLSKEIRHQCLKIDLYFKKGNLLHQLSLASLCNHKI